MNNPNTNPQESSVTELPPGAFGCTPREPAREEENLLGLLIAQLDELTRPHYGGKLK